MNEWMNVIFRRQPALVCCVMTEYEDAFCSLRVLVCLRLCVCLFMHINVVCLSIFHEWMNDWINEWMNECYFQTTTCISVLCDDWMWWYSLCTTCIGLPESVFVHLWIWMCNCVNDEEQSLLSTDYWLTSRHLAE